MTNLTAWALLIGATLFEFIATNLLNNSDGFRKITPTMLSLIFYAMSFFMFARSATKIPLEIAYAIWCGLGIFFIALIGIFYYRHHFSLMTWIGISFIMLGTILASLSGDIQ